MAITDIRHRTIELPGYAQQMTRQFADEFHPLTQPEETLTRRGYVRRARKSTSFFPEPISLRAGYTAPLFRWGANVSGFPAAPTGCRKEVYSPFSDPFQGIILVSVLSRRK